MDLREQLAKQILPRLKEEKIRKDKKKKEHDAEFNEQVKPYEDGTKFGCQVWGEGILRGIIFECEHFYESRWSPKFCTHESVKHETNPHWNGTSCEGIGKDLEYNKPHDIWPDWCPLKNK